MNRWTHSGNLILAGFLLALGLMSLLVYKSCQQKFDMVTDKYYEKELVFQKQLDAAANAKPYDSLFAIHQSPGILVLSIPASLASELRQGSVEFYCPSGAENDKNFTLTKIGNGNYTFDTKRWHKLSYIAKISFEAGGKSFYKELPVTLL